MATTEKRRGLNVRRLRKQATELQTAGNWLKLEAGKHMVRFMPNVNDPDGLFGTYVERYWFDRPDGTNRFPLTSPRTLDPEAYCPAHAAYLATAGDAHDDENRGIERETFFLSNVLLWDDATKAWEPTVLYLSTALYRDITNKQLDVLSEDDIDADGYLKGYGIADPKTGVVVSITRKGSGRKTKWSVTITPKKVPLTKQHWKARIDFHTSDKDVKPASVEDLERAVCDHMDVDDISEIIGDSGARASGKKRGKKRSKPDTRDVIADEDDDLDIEGDDDLDIDDDVEEEDDEEDFPDEEVGVRKRRVKRTNKGSARKPRRAS